LRPFVARAVAHEIGGFVVIVAPLFGVPPQRGGRNAERAAELRLRHVAAHLPRFHLGGAVYEFAQGDIVKGSGYISWQCCGSSEIELGTVYAAEMGISLFSDIDRYTLEDAKVELFYHLLLSDGTYEEVPMGVFEVSEAKANGWRTS